MTPVRAAELFELIAVGVKLRVRVPVVDVEPVVVVHNLYAQL